MVFARSVLLVEGEGDREFFENLRRRIAPLDGTGAIDKLAVIPTGSKTFFAPWIELISSYGSPTARHLGRTGPIRWLALVDGDGAGDILDAAKLAGIRLPRSARFRLEELAEANEEADLDRRIDLAKRVNRQSLLTNPVMVALGDLEWMTLAGLPDEVAGMLADRAALDCTSGEELARALGSKHFASPRREPVKSPWIRAVMGREIRGRTSPRILVSL